MNYEEELQELKKRVKELERHTLKINKELTVSVPYIKFTDDTPFIPTRTKDGDCGFDAYAAQNVRLLPHTASKVPLGVGFIIPEPFGIKCETRSGNFLKGINIGSAWVDRGYRGQVHALVQNTTDNEIQILKGDRICSLELELTFKINFVDAKEVYTEEEFNNIMNTERGATGFGSSGN